MDNETLKTILELQHNNSMIKRILADLALSLKSPDEPTFRYNYHVEDTLQGLADNIHDRIEKLKKRIIELEAELKEKSQ